MDESAVQPYKFTPSFYDEYLHDDENIQAKIKPILNQILESRGKYY